MIVPDQVYGELCFPQPPEGRPYTFINMVTTIDGKSVSGTAQEPVGDLGSDLDHRTMRRLESAADGVLIGAGALRSTPGLWYPADKFRIVATASGSLDYGCRFFSDAPDKAVVIAPETTDVPKEFLKLENNFGKAFRFLRQKLGIEVLAIEGGANLNGQLLQDDLIDELFLTLAPKIRLGDGLPTYAGGFALPRERIQNYALLEHHQVGDELFLRYRRKRTI